MRILFLQHAVGPGGSAVSLRFLAGALAARGHDVHLVLNQAASGMRAFYAAEGIEVHTVPTLPSVLHTTAAHVSPLRPRSLLATGRMIARYPAARRTLLQLVDRVRPDVLHLNSATLAPTALILRSRQIPVVWHIRESPPFGPRGLRTAALRTAMQRHAAETIFISDDDRRTWAQGRFGTVIYNCATPPADGGEAVAVSVRQRLGLAPKNPIVLFLGGFQEIKGIAPLLEAMPSIERAVPGARLVVLGADPSPPSSALAAIARAATKMAGVEPFHMRMRRHAADRTLAEIVRVLPSVDGIGDFLAACDVVAFPSLRPHFARPVIEAALAAKPVVASRLGGVEELVAHGETGLLVSPGDPVDLADGIIRVLENRELASRLGAAARERAADRFSVASHVNAVLAVYDRVRAGGACRS